MTEIVTVPAIVGFCYIVGFCIKLFKNEKLDNFIPGICAVIGVILGLVAFFTIPNFIPADNWITASVIGGFSGLAATGVNQVVKKIKAILDSQEG